MELISKKELLDEKNISYGQLYRWKRKNLIPEEWFIRKSTFTGQETFFPREKILARIDKIQDMKENLSLDDLAEVFSPNVNEMAFTPEQMVASGFISEPAFNFFIEQRQFTGQYTFEDIIQVYLVDQLLGAGDISQEEAKLLLELLKGKDQLLKSKPCEIVFTRKFGVSSCVLVTNQESLFFEETTRVVKRIAFGTISEQLKSKLMGGEKHD